MSLPALPPSPAGCGPHGSAACMQQSAGHFYGQVGHFFGEVFGPVFGPTPGYPIYHGDPVGRVLWVALIVAALCTAWLALMFLGGTRSPSERVREFWHRAITGGWQS